MNRQEIWMSVRDYVGLYEVSNYGDVRNARTGNILKLKKTKFGYLQVGLWKDGKQKKFRVHRLVYEAFNGKIPEGLVIDHEDAVKTNNCLSNLRCCTQKENCNNPNTLTDEWRKNQTEAMRNKSPEWRRNIAEAMRNKSPEWRRKNAEAIRKARGKAVVQIDKVTGETIKRFECAMDVERELGIWQASISACCLGKRKSAGGYRWSFATYVI